MRKQRIPLNHRTVARLFHAKNDEDTIATWKKDLDRILHIFNVRSFGSV